MPPLAYGTFLFSSFPKTAWKKSCLLPRYFQPSSSGSSSSYFYRQLSSSREESSSSSSQFGNLPVDEDDLQLLRGMNSRIVSVPILIVANNAGSSSSVLLPGEMFEYSSDDPRFHEMIQTVLSSSLLSSNNECSHCIGVIGMHPMYPNRALSLGVTVPIDTNSVFVDSSSSTLTIKGVASKRFEVIGEPWLDENDKLFHWAHVDVTDRSEDLDKHQQEDLKVKFEQIPSLVQEWLDLLLAKHIADFMILKKVYKRIGPMPLQNDRDYTRMANWVAALINNNFMQEVCIDIRAAMLACRSNADRLNLAVTAIESSIRQLQMAA